MKEFKAAFAVVSEGKSSIDIHQVSIHDMGASYFSTFCLYRVIIDPYNQKMYTFAIFCFFRS